MRRRAGMTLIELIVAVSLWSVVLGLVTAIGLRFEASARHLAATMGDLRTGERFAADVKRDLARASAAAAEPGRLRLTLDGAETVYAFHPEEGSVTRTGPEPAREYRYAFERVEFEGPERGLARVTVELRRHDPESSVRPRWRSTVRCAGRNE